MPVPEGVEIDPRTRVVAGSIQRVAICVCTFRRPKMLERCLNSLACQVVDKGIELEIVVIDNEDWPNNFDAVKDGFLDVWIHPRFHYVHEPRRGIACARNAALNMAAELNADWIAFIDDDEIAATDWIAQLMAPEYLDVPVVVGVSSPVFASRLPFWVLDNQAAKGIEGERVKTAYTGSVRFSMDLVQSGLRFDEGLGLMGGEDNEFFAHANAMGFEIRRTLRAVALETVHPERLTYRGQVYRSYWCACSELRRLSIVKGWAGAMLRKGHTVPLNLIIGALEVAASPLFVVAGLSAFKRRALAGGKKLAKGAGRAAAIIGRLPAPYRNVVGN